MADENRVRFTISSSEGAESDTESTSSRHRHGSTDSISSLNRAQAFYMADLMNGKTISGDSGSDSSNGSSSEKS
ncbi:hypothetical protein LSH36_11g02010, partial [Paralvinella palmiformis]